MPSCGCGYEVTSLGSGILNQTIRDSPCSTSLSSSFSFTTLSFVPFLLSSFSPSPFFPFFCDLPLFGFLWPLDLVQPLHSSHDQKGNSFNQAPVTYIPHLLMSY